MSSSPATYRRSITHQWDGLLMAGAIGPVLFLTVMLLGIVVGGRTSGSGAGSGMELGQYGWLMSILFIITGSCVLAFAVGQYRALTPASRVGTALLGTAGVAVVASGIFLPDASGAAQSDHGQVHNMLFLVVMLALTISFTWNGTTMRRNGFRGALAHSVASTAALPILVGVFVTVGSDPGDPLYSIGALIEFALVAVGFGWVAVNSARILLAGRR